MISADDVFKPVQRVMGNHTRIEDAQIWRAINTALIELSEERYWSFLAYDEELDFSDAVDGALVMRSDCAGIRTAWSPAGIRFHRSTKGRSVNDDSLDDPRYRWFWDNAVEDSLSVETGSISKNGTAISWSGSPDDATGEYVKIGDSSGLYRLTDATTITPRWYGPNQSGVTIHVRPAGTKRLGATVETGALYTGTMKLYGWRRHHEVFDGSQVIIFPLADAVIQLSLYHLMFLDRKERYANGYMDRFMSISLPALCKTDPLPIGSLSPEGRGGSRRGFYTHV